MLREINNMQLFTEGVCQENASANFTEGNTAWFASQTDLYTALQALPEHA